MTAMATLFHMPDPRSVLARIAGLWKPIRATSIDDLAARMGDTLREVQEGTKALIAWANEARAAVDLLEEIDMDDVQREAARRISDNSERVFSLHLEIDEAHPLAQVGRLVIQPYNDALREARRATLELGAAARSALARGEAEDAEDEALFSTAIVEQAVPWDEAKARLFPT